MVSFFRCPVFQFQILPAPTTRKGYLLEIIRQTAIYLMGFVAGREDSKEASVCCEVRRFTMIIRVSTFKGIISQVKYCASRITRCRFQFYTKDDIWRKMTHAERRHMTKDDTWRKMTHDERWHDERWHDERWHDERWHMTKDDIWRKMTYDERWHMTKASNIFILRYVTT